jgi:hypothetical protein
MSRSLQPLVLTVCTAVLVAASAAPPAPAPKLDTPAYAIMGKEKAGAKRTLIRLTIHHPSEEFDEANTKVLNTSKLEMDGHEYPVTKLILKKHKNNTKHDTATLWLIVGGYPLTEDGVLRAGTGTLTLNTTVPTGTGTTTIVSDPTLDPCADCPPPP